jgi:hypothetical protein
MNETKAIEILEQFISEDGLFCSGKYLAYKNGETEITLDATFDIDELDAIVWWMKNHIGNADDPTKA